MVSNRHSLGHSIPCHGDGELNKLILVSDKAGGLQLGAFVVKEFIRK